jgi:DNA-binding LacI/PurR family transcriptional regulator
MVPAMATLGDVARHAGVSAASVSRALNYPAKVSPEMRKGVASTMAELGDVRDGAVRPHVRLERTGKG